MTNIQETLTLAGGALAVLFGFAKVGQYVLNAFHNEKVVPGLVAVSEAIRQNTSATALLTQALGTTNQTARETQHENAEAFGAIREMVADHRSRLDVHEVRLDGHDAALSRPAPKSAARIRGKRP